MLNLIKKLAIVDAANITQLDNIMSGVDGASTFGYSLTPTAVQVNDNQRQQYKFTHQLDVRTLDPGSTDRSNLAFIEQNQRTVTAVGLSEDGFLYLQGKLTRNDQYDQVVADRFLLTADTVAGYVNGYYSGDNLLGMYDVLNANGTGNVNLGISSSGQEITFTRLGGSGAVTFNAAFQGAADSFFLPFPGEVISFQFDVVSFVETTGTTAIQLLYLNAAGGTITTSTTTISSTGINSITSIMPSATVRVRPRLILGDTPGDNIVLKQPMLSRRLTTFAL